MDRRRQTQKKTALGRYRKANEWIEDWLEAYYAFKEYEDCMLAPEWERFLDDYKVNHAPRLSEQEEREFGVIRAIWPPGGLKPVRDLEPLVALLRDTRSRDGLTPLIRKLVDEIFPERTGRPGRPRVARLPMRHRGRPRMTEEERRKINPVHNADDELSVVKGIMNSEYPDQSAEEVNNAAIALVSRRHGVKKLRTHSMRSKNDHRRAGTHPRPKPPKRPKPSNSST